MQRNSRATRIGSNNLKNEPDANLHPASLRAVGAEAVVAGYIQGSGRGRENPFRFGERMAAGEASGRPTVGEIEAVEGDPQLIVFANRDDFGESRIGTVLRRKVQAVYGQEGHSAAQAGAVYIEVGKHAGDGRIVNFDVWAAMRLTTLHGGDIRELPVVHNVLEERTAAMSD